MEIQKYGMTIAADPIIWQMMHRVAQINSEILISWFIIFILLPISPWNLRFSRGPLPPNMKKMIISRWICGQIGVVDLQGGHFYPVGEWTSQKVWQPGIA